MRNDFESNYLAHFQIVGAKHGVRRYQNFDGSLTPEGRIRYGVGDPRKAKGKQDEEPKQKKKGFISRAKERKAAKLKEQQRKAALEKARQAKIKKAEEKKKAEEYEKNRQDVLMKGKASDIKQYQGNITNDEYNYVLRRLENEARINALSASEQEKRIKKIDSYAKKIATVTAWADTALVAYNTVADVYNAFSRQNERNGLPKVQGRNYYERIKMKGG